MPYAGGGSACFIMALNFCGVRQVQFSNMKKGPSFLPRIAMYLRVARTGQRSVSLRAMVTSAPFRNWSVFGRFLMI